MKGIEGVVLDLDDTLSYGSNLFRSSVQNMSQLISTVKGIPFEDVKEILDTFNKERYAKHFANRFEGSPEFIQRTVDFFELNPEQRSQIQKFNDSIYNTIPEVREDAFPLLEGLRDMNMKIAINTLADRDWTLFKLKETGLINYVNAFNCTWIGPKTSNSWREAAAMIGLKPSECAMVGDSKSSDIAPATEAGYGMRFWLDSSSWDIAKQGELDAEAIRIESLDSVIPTIKEFQNPELRINRY